MKCEKCKNPAGLKGQPALYFFKDAVVCLLCVMQLPVGSPARRYVNSINNQGTHNPQILDRPLFVDNV